MVVGMATAMPDPAVALAWRPEPEAPAAPAAPAAPPAARRRGRVLALDLFRGLMVVGMVLVNNQGSGSHVVPGLGHARWNGLTPADVVFPGFLVAMGAAMGLATRPPSWWRV